MVRIERWQWFTSVNNNATEKRETDLNDRPIIGVIFIQFTRNGNIINSNIYDYTLSKQEKIRFLRSRLF